MVEILLGALIILILNRKRRPTFHEEVRDLLVSSSDGASIAVEIKRYLIAVMDDENNDREKYSDERLAQAQALLDRAGPSAFYWMSEIAGKLAALAAAQINGIPTNVTEELTAGATPEDVIKVVVKV